MRIESGWKVPVLLTGTSSGAAAANWWEAGGASGCVQSLRAIGAASFAASKLDLSGSGNNASNGAAFPTWDAVNGWTHVRLSSQYLDSGIVPTVDGTWSMFVRYVSNAIGVGTFPIPMGQNEADVTFPQFAIILDTAATYFRNGSVTGYTHGSAITSGVVGIAGNKAYLNGTNIGTLTTGATAAIRSLFIGALHTYDGSATNFFDGTIQATGIWNNTLSATQAAAVSAALAALT